MTTELVCVVAIAVILIGAVILALAVPKLLRNSGSIELVRGKLENSDNSIKDAMSYLKITNEWGE